MINNLNEILESVFYKESKIINYSFDMLKNEINFKVNFQHTENDVSKIINYNLNFKKVSSFFFVKSQGKDRFFNPNNYEYEDGDYLELSSIAYHENGLGKIMINSKENFPKQYYGNTNFSLEIWESILFIEAGIVEINGKVYHTKKLADSSVE